MKKFFNVILLLIAGAVLFSGCSQQQAAVARIKGESGTFRMAVHNYEEHSGIFRSISGNRDVHIKYLFQENAEFALSIGAKYFRVVRPFDSSADMMSTPAELRDRCFDHLFIGNIIGSDYCVYIKKHVAMDTVQYFKERPKDFLVFDAQEIIDYLKDEDLYVDTTDLFTGRKRYQNLNLKLRYHK